jgi:hypothetical protein
MNIVCTLPRGAAFRQGMAIFYRYRVLGPGKTPGGKQCRYYRNNLVDINKQSSYGEGMWIDKTAIHWILLNEGDKNEGWINFRTAKKFPGTIPSV